MSTKFLIHFAQIHTDFRIAELESLARLNGINVDLHKGSPDLSSPYLVVELQSIDEAKKLIERSILVKEICEYWAEGKTYEELFEKIKQNPERNMLYKKDSFKFNVDVFGGSNTEEEKLRKINNFSFLPFKGPIDLKKPNQEFMVYENYGDVDSPGGRSSEPKVIYFGRRIASSSRYEMIKKFTLKQRKYLGTTSMDAELSLVMANQALARPGTLMYDPFVGTGSMMLTCAEFGSYTMGSDIDGRQIRGTAGYRKGINGIKANIDQYKLSHRILGNVVFDICQNPWRAMDLYKDSGWIDLIVTDPPYGVRAGAKKLGRRNGTVEDYSFKIVDGVENHKRKDYYPPTVAYEMEDVVVDLLEFAAKMLVVRGRLVYWIPTVTEEYQLDDIPIHPALELVANSEQPFGSWSRRLITMEKIREWSEADSKVYNTNPADSENSSRCTSSTSLSGLPNNKPSPAHRNFRARYFSKFIRQDSPATPADAGN
ncbi:hypothetical protein H4219_002196 [Mycoemilia scoparia]|uniref:tRNA (guanine(10)-N(2))-methyltransferase n=1 Tax=Mycoemilia scoparia TaxID=417184 RepID=A0A9W7ZYG1_9FUNG|nr:hypothetical protein H4219_002196 [Mycoemilia scoparia]